MQESEITETADETQQSHLLGMGCGRGRIAHYLATMTGGQVSGYNIDPNQLENAVERAAECDLHAFFEAESMSPQ